MSHEPVQHEPEIPPRLAEAIRRYEPSGVGVGFSGLDRAVLGEAGRRLRGGRGRRMRTGVIWRMGGAVAAAAGLAMAVWVAWPRGGGGAPAAALVYDANKPVTILDAFALARMLERPGTGVGLSPTWDVTGDGAIDQRDVDAIAASAVRLGGTGGGA